MTPALTTAQLLTLKAAIDADPMLSVLPNNSDSAFTIAAAFNSPANPVFIVWKTRVSLDEIQQNGFDWTQVDNLTDPKARTWEWMFNNQERTVNPSKLNVRAGINEVWQGTAGKLNVRAQVYVHCKRSASRAEKLFSTGTGSDADPATMASSGDLSYQEIESARAAV